jgi:transposase
MGGEAMKYYIGIDIGKYHHQAILCDIEAKPIAESIKFKATSEGFSELFAYIRKHVAEEDQAQIQAGLEATGPYWLTLYEQLIKQGIKVSVLNPMQVKAYRNEGIRGAKTDRIDALLSST